MNKNMFGIDAKALMKSLGADKTLISNSDLSNQLDLLKLVKVTKPQFFSVHQYKPQELSLPLLMDDKEFCPGFEEKELVGDFITKLEMKGSGNVGGGDGVVSNAKVSASADNVDGQKAPVDIISKKVKLERVMDWFDSRTINRNKLQRLDLKKRDRLMFVHQIVYNTGPVELFSTSKMGGCFSACFQKMVNVSVKGNQEVGTSFTVPEKSTFAYGLMEIKGVREEKPYISYEPWEKNMYDKLMGSDGEGDSENFVSLQQVKEALEMKTGALQPLEDVLDSTSRKLLNTLSELLKDREALTLLEQTLESGTAACEDPQSEAVSAFLDALNVSTTTPDQKDAVHLLVIALDILPDDVPALLIGCSPDVLRVLKQLVDGLQEDDQNQLPEALPPPLQEDGELGWVAPLLCSTDDMLAESERLTPELPPGVLLEVVALVVHGLSLMQNL